MRPASSKPALHRSTALALGAALCVLAAAALGARAELSVMAAGLALGALASFRPVSMRSGLPGTAVAWLGAGGVASTLTWGLREDCLSGYATAALQLIAGAVLLPGHLRRSARRTVASTRAGRSGG